LWHKEWAGGRLQFACDNTTVVQVLHKKSAKGEPIHPLQTILLIAAVFNIKNLEFWIPSEEKIVADAASRHDYKKLAGPWFPGFRTPASYRRYKNVDLAPEAIFLFEKSLAPATKKKYDSACSSYETFCCLHRYKPLSASVKAITHWLVKVMQKAKPTTAKSYASALRSTHIRCGADIEAFDDDRIDLVIRGGKRFYGEGEKRLRLPLTAPILHRIVNGIRDDYDGVNLKKALCVAFAGFL
jgi:hypothetical protein